MPAPARDRVFLNSLRETFVILAGFVVFLLWTLGVSGWLGYSDGLADSPVMVWGMPRWVFWGVFLPWIAADAFTIWFCFFYMADDVLTAPESTAEDRSDRGLDANPSDIA